MPLAPGGFERRDDGDDVTAVEVNRWRKGGKPGQWFVAISLTTEPGARLYLEAFADRLAEGSRRRRTCPQAGFCP